jgi:pimeloyl-ACP methyl ester carboxylesterase
MQVSFLQQLGLLLAWWALLLGPAAAQHRGAARTYQVGYQQLKRYDVARSFDTTRVDSLRFRPVQIDLFYPASPSTPVAALPYGYFLNAYGSRLNFHLSADSCRRVGAQLAAYLRAGLDLGAADELETLPTQSHFAAPLAPGPFPLVLYCPAYNGLSYENVVLLERLASRGYLVAAISSVGRYPGYMTMDPVDIREQVADAQFARRYLQQTGRILSTQVAVLGYSWGGLAATLLAMQVPPVQAVISLDGADRYEYGEDAADDAHFSRIRRAAYFTPRRLIAPYLYLSSGREAPEFLVDSVYQLATSARATAYVRLPRTQHADFSCLPTLAHRFGPPLPNPLAYSLVERLVAGWLAAYLTQAGSFSDTLRTLLRHYPTRLTRATPPRAAPSASVAQVLHGTTTDALGHPLPYVSIGLVGGNQGTVSRSDGTFDLRLHGVQATDTVRLSCVGYQRRGWRLADLPALANGHPLRLALQEQHTTLAEVVVRATKPVRRVLGNATTSQALNVGFGSAESGAQVGIPLHLGNRLVTLEKVTIPLSYNRYDSLLLRLNVYRLEHGVPTYPLLAEQVLVHWGSQTGPVSFDLTRRPLSVTGSVLVAVELVAGWGGPQKGLYVAAGFLRGPSYYRRTSEGAWRRARGMGVDIQATTILEQVP